MPNNPNQSNLISIDFNYQLIQQCNYELTLTITALESMQILEFDARIDYLFTYISATITPLTQVPSQQAPTISQSEGNLIAYMYDLDNGDRYIIQLIVSYNVGNNADPSTIVLRDMGYNADNNGWSGIPDYAIITADCPPCCEACNTIEDTLLSYECDVNFIAETTTVNLAPEGKVLTVNLNVPNKCHKDIAVLVTLNEVFIDHTEVPIAYRVIKIAASNYDYSNNPTINKCNGITFIIPPSDTETEECPRKFILRTQGHYLAPIGMPPTYSFTPCSCPTCPNKQCNNCNYRSCPPNKVLQRDTCTCNVKCEIQQCPPNSKFDQILCRCVQPLPQCNITSCPIGQILDITRCKCILTSECNITACPVGQILDPCACRCIIDSNENH